MEQQSIASALGIQHGGDPWHRRAACKGQPWSIFFHEGGSNKKEDTIFTARAKRICARCPVRRQCLEDAYQAESPQQAIARNAAKPHGSWTAAARLERQLPVGVFGGATARERWAPDLVHLDDCRGDCKGCRPVHGRVEILEEQLSKQAHRFLLSSEKLTPLG